MTEKIQKDRLEKPEWMTDDDFSKVNSVFSKVTAKRIAAGRASEEEKRLHAICSADDASYPQALVDLLALDSSTTGGGTVPVLLLLPRRGADSTT